MATLARVRAAPPCSVTGKPVAGTAPAGVPLAASSCGAGKSAYRSQTTSIARTAAVTRVSSTPAPRMSAWKVRTGTTAVAFSSIVAGSEGCPAARSRIAKPRKKSSPSAAIRISNRSAKAALTAKAAPPVTAITATSATACPGRGSPAIVPQTNASVVAKASRSAARCLAISGDKGQYRDKPDPEPGECIRDRVLARVEDDAGPRIVSHAVWWPVGGLEHQLHREALGRRQPSAGTLARLRQAGYGIHIALADAPTDALHPRRQHATGQHVEHHLGLQARLDVLQAVLTQEGLQPHQPRVEEGQRRLADRRELPGVELQVAHYAVAGCEQGGAGEVESCLLERSQRLADLRIVGALGTELLARLLKRGLRLLHIRLGRVQLRPCLVAFRRRIDASADQLEDARRLLADVAPLRDLLHQLRLSRIHRRGGGADGLPGRGELGFGTLDGDAEGGRVDAVQQIAGPDDLVVTHPDLDDLARDLRYGAHHEGAHAGVAGVGCQPVGNQRPAEQQDAEDEDDQRPAPQRIGGPGRPRRRRDLLGLRSPHFVHAEYRRLTRVPRWAGEPTEIRQLPAGFEARITSLTSLGNGKSRAERVNGDRRRRLIAPNQRMRAALLAPRHGCREAVPRPAMRWVGARRASARPLTIINGNVSPLRRRVSSSSRPLIPGI